MGQNMSLVNFKAGNELISIYHKIKKIREIEMMIFEIFKKSFFFHTIVDFPRILRLDLRSRLICSDFL